MIIEKGFNTSLCRGDYPVNISGSLPPLIIEHDTLPLNKEYKQGGL